MQKDQPTRNDAEIANHVVSPEQRPILNTEVMKKIGEGKVVPEIIRFEQVEKGGRFFKRPRHVEQEDLEQLVECGDWNARIPPDEVFRDKEHIAMVWNPMETPYLEADLPNACSLSTGCLVYFDHDDLVIDIRDAIEGYDN